MLIDAKICEFVGDADSKIMLSRRPTWVGGNISQFDQPLLIGLTKLLRPRKVVEIGVASGWSACLFIDALTSNHQPAQYIGIDYSPIFYLDSTRKTGSAIQELFPESAIDCNLYLGNVAVDVLDQLGTGVELAFIDGDHHHPWAILDLLTLLPTLASSAYVILHDLNLSTVERHKHTNRGPKYLYECWPFAKIHSSQNPPMIGAIQMPITMDDSTFNLLLDTVHTPWEVYVDAVILKKISTTIESAYGYNWGEKFQKAFEEMNCTVSKFQFIKNGVSQQRFINNLIDITSKLSDIDKAINLLQEALQLWPDNWKLLHHLAVALNKAGDNQSALNASRRASEFNSSNGHILSFYGQLLFEAGNLTEAEKLMHSAIESQGDVATFHHRLAVLLVKDNRFNEALECVTRAKKLAPGNTQLTKLYEHLSKICATFSQNGALSNK